MLLLILCLMCFSAQAQVRPRGGPPEAPRREARGDEDVRLRRERLQEFREEMRRQDVQRQEARERRGAEFVQDPPRQARRVEVEQDAGGGRPLRRLSSEERQRLRQEMREAFHR